MGAKVTIDSATLMNKALELIEAHWLFGLEADRLDAVIHPTSTVHALIEMGDGTVVSQLGAPDMRTPILRALAFPHRCPDALSRLDLANLGSLEFRPIVGGWRRAIDMALRVIRAGGDAGAVFNAGQRGSRQRVPRSPCAVRSHHGDRRCRVFGPHGRPGQRA
jgi:1-deoxy-D-xylulose-5-phosphate reductoisomerase